MTLPTIVIIVLGMVAGIGLTAAIAAAVPTTPHLGDTLARLHTHPIQQRRSKTGTNVSGNLDDSGKLDRVGQWLARFAPPIPLPTATYTDLDILAISPARHRAHRAIATGLGFLAPTVIGIGYSLLGLGIPWVLPPLIGIITAAGASIVPVLNVRQRAITARDRFSRAVTSYIDLVVLGRLGNAGVATAIRQPAHYANAPLFIRIREALNRWTLQRIPPWEALDRLAEDLDLPELAELAEALEQSGTRSAAVADTLTARAADIRSRFLASDITKAHVSVQRLGISIMLLLAVFLIFVTVPFFDTFLRM